MLGKKAKTAVAVGVAVLAIAVGVATARCSADMRADRERENVPEAQEEVVGGSSEEREEPKEILPVENIKGAEDVGLPEARRENLAEMLTSYFSGKDEPAQAEYALRDTGEVSEGYRVLELQDIGTGEVYVVYDDGSRFMVYPESVAGVSDGAEQPQEQPQDQPSPPALPTQEHVEQMEEADRNKHGALHSSETDFDTMKAWSLGDREAVDPVIGAAAASTLYEKLAERFAQEGVAIESPDYVLVSEEGVEVDVDKVAFRAIVLHGGDGTVVECTYGLGTGEYSFELMP